MCCLKVRSQLIVLRSSGRSHDSRLINIKKHKISSVGLSNDVVLFKIYMLHIFQIFCVLQCIRAHGSSIYFSKIHSVSYFILLVYMLLQKKVEKGYIKNESIWQPK